MSKIKKSKKINPEFMVLALIMMINALSYGTIIPLLYPYASRFGINPFGLSLLFASFSLFQFLATPVIGRLSDRYGRKPLLLISLLGTSISLALFASATSVAMLFIARIFDGITGGNVSVAQAMLADKVKKEDRAQAFAMLGAAFGFGFLVGPALGGILSVYGLTIPFWFGSALALTATIIAALVLKESATKKNIKKQKTETLFNFSALFKALFNPIIGAVLTVSFIAALAQNVFIIGFQAYTVDVLLLSAQRVGILFATAGFVTIIMQVFGIKFLIRRFKAKSNIIKYSLLISSAVMMVMAMSLPYYWFIISIFSYVLAHTAITPIITALISERTNPEDQGAMLGINQSYISLGQIFGPLSAGVVSSVSIPLVFVWGSILMFSGFLFVQFNKPKKQKVNI